MILLALLCYVAAADKAVVLPSVNRSWPFHPHTNVNFSLIFSNGSSARSPFAIVEHHKQQRDYLCNVSATPVHRLGRHVFVFDRLDVDDNETLHVYCIEPLHGSVLLNASLVPCYRCEYPVNADYNGEIWDFDIEQHKIALLTGACALILLACVCLNRSCHRRPKEHVELDDGEGGGGGGSGVSHI
jgi:hypothetical protein